MLSQLEQAVLDWLVDEGLFDEACAEASASARFGDGGGRFWQLVADEVDSRTDDSPGVRAARQWVDGDDDNYDAFVAAVIEIGQTAVSCLRCNKVVPRTHAQPVLGSWLGVRCCGGKRSE